MDNDTVKLLRERLSVLAPSTLVIEDESQHHAGHAGAREGGHFRLFIVAAAFAGKSTLARHRLVYDAAGDLKQCGIHALAIRAQTPEEI
jgi:BolA protein